MMTTSRSEGPARPSAIIVDDDRDTREMLAMALELEGYDVTQAANGVKLISSLHVHRPEALAAGHQRVPHRLHQTPGRSVEAPQPVGQERLDAPAAGLQPRLELERAHLGSPPARRSTSWRIRPRSASKSMGLVK